MTALSVRAARRGDMCDKHNKIPAIGRVTSSGEYDYIPQLVCGPCLQSLKDKQKVQMQKLVECEWCRTKKMNVIPFRDKEEGPNGQLYNVCTECRRTYTNSLLERNDPLTMEKLTGAEPIESVDDGSLDDVEDE